jgi:hypothetical protein
MIVVTVALLLLAAVATYFVARASLAVVAIRKDVAALRKQVKGVINEAHKTERTAARVSDKLYRQTQDIAAMLQDPTVQRALRKEGRN